MENEIIKYNLAIISEKVIKAKDKYNEIINQKGYEILCLINNCIIAIDGEQISIKDYNIIEKELNKVLTKKYSLKSVYVLKAGETRRPSHHLKPFKN